MFDSIIAMIRTRSREGWEAYVRARCVAAREWAQNHGEKAAVVAFVLGMVLVLAFKLVVGLLMISVLLGYGVWHIALPEGEGGSSGQSAQK